MNWNQDKSLKLTKVCARVFALLLLALAMGAPWLLGEFLKLRGPVLEGKLYYFLATSYSTAVPAAIALYQMNGLLNNISRNQVFIPKNTGYIRGMSWCCLAAGIIFGASGFYYAAFWILCGAAFFVSLLLRVIKNVFVQAGEIKEENDYTI